MISCNDLSLISLVLSGISVSIALYVAISKKQDNKKATNRQTTDSIYRLLDDKNFDKISFRSSEFDKLDVLGSWKKTYNSH